MSTITPAHRSVFEQAADSEAVQKPRKSLGTDRAATKVMFIPEEVQ